MRDCRSQRRKPGGNKGGCVPRKPGPLLNSYADIIRDFENRYRRGGARDLRFYAIQRNLEDVVELAGLAKAANGKRQSHQRRIPPAVLLMPDALKQARERAGLTIESVAAKGPMDKGTIANYEAGQTTPWMPYFLQLLDICGFDLHGFHELVIKLRYQEQLAAIIDALKTSGAVPEQFALELNQYLKSIS